MRPLTTKAFMALFGAGLLGCFKLSFCGLRWRHCLFFGCSRTDFDEFPITLADDQPSESAGRNVVHHYSEFLHHSPLFAIRRDTSKEGSVGRQDGR